MTTKLGDAVGIGIPTGESTGRRQRHCPGALLRVTDMEYEALKHEGLRWDTPQREIRRDGLSDARVFCNRDVAEIRKPGYKTAEGKEIVTIYYAALCSSCSDLERINRATLAQKFGAK